LPRRKHNGSCTRKEMISVYTIAYNEEVLAPHFIKHYRSQWDCNITVYDNQSTDRTREIFEADNCKVIEFDTNNEINEHKYLSIKNECWKSAETDWVIVCDMDEFLFKPNDTAATVIQSECYDMYGIKDTINLEEMQWGIRYTLYDKILMFNKSKISDINYTFGCHTASPVGDVVYGTAKMLHYKNLSVDYVVQRSKEFNKRLSAENLKNKWGNHYQKDEETMRRNYAETLKNLQLINNG